jgi:hypothetical protein
MVQNLLRLDNQALCDSPVVRGRLCEVIFVPPDFYIAIMAQILDEILLFPAKMGLKLGTLSVSRIYEIEKRSKGSRLTSPGWVR